MRNNPRTREADLTRLGIKPAETVAEPIAELEAQPPATRKPRASKQAAKPDTPSIEEPAPPESTVD